MGTGAGARLARGKELKWQPSKPCRTTTASSECPGTLPKMASGGPTLGRRGSTIPDLHADEPATVEAMRDVNAAYETLSDPVLRTRYDSHRTTIRVRPFDTEPVRVAPGDLRAPRTRRHHRHSREPGVLDAALLLLQRLTRCVSA